MPGLFRTEVLQHRQRDWLGSISLNRPVSLTVLTFGVVLMLVAVVAFLRIGEYTRTARLTGYLAADRRNGALQADVFAPAEVVGTVLATQKVQIRYPAFPQFGRAGGEVVQVSTVPLSSDEQAGRPWQTTDHPRGSPLYRITVQLDIPTVRAEVRMQPLVAGMQVEAEVSLERRRLIDWIFKPAHGVAGPR